MSRRLTGAEEAEIAAATERISAVQDELDRLLSERDQLLADIAAAGARISDIADILAVTRRTVYKMIDRAKDR